MLMTALRYLWALPTTCVGLVLVPPTLASGGRMQFVSGVLELHGGLVGWILRRLVPIPGGASAMTLGHVVIGRDVGALDRSRDHERIHVRQVERWGPLFLPAYLACSVWLWLRRKNPYLDNPFEKEAYGTEFGLDA